MDQKDMMYPHIDNFLSCMRTREKPHLDVETGAKAVIVINLAAQCYREGKTMYWDEKNWKAWTSPSKRSGYCFSGRRDKPPAHDRRKRLSYLTESTGCEARTVFLVLPRKMSNRAAGGIDRRPSRIQSNPRVSAYPRRTRFCRCKLPNPGNTSGLV